MRQARYLVKRLKRFNKELPAAQSSLRELLSQQPTPEEGWTSFLAEAKVELQHMAQGMLRGNCRGMAAFCCYEIGAAGMTGYDLVSLCHGAMISSVSGGCIYPVER